MHFCRFFTVQYLPVCEPICEFVNFLFLVQSKCMQIYLLFIFVLMFFSVPAGMRTPKPYMRVLAGWECGCV